MQNPRTSSHVARPATPVAYLSVANTASGWLARREPDGALVEVTLLAREVGAEVSLSRVRGWLGTLSAIGAHAPTDVVRVGERIAVVTPAGRALIRDQAGRGASRDGEEVGPVIETADLPATDLPGADAQALGVILLRTLGAELAELPQDAEAYDGVVLDAVLRLGEIPMGLSSFVMACLEFDPIARPTPDEVATALPDLVTEWEAEWDQTEPIGLEPPPPRVGSPALVTEAPPQAPLPEDGDAAPRDGWGPGTGDDPSTLPEAAFAVPEEEAAASSAPEPAPAPTPPETVAAPPLTPAPAAPPAPGRSVSAVRIGLVLVLIVAALGAVAFVFGLPPFG